MATHTVTCDAHSVGIYLVEGGEDCLWEFVGDIGIHFIVRGPGSGSGVNVESSTGTKVIGVIFALDSKSPYSMSVLPCTFRRGNTLGLVSGYKTAIPLLLAPCWKKPFSEQLSPVQVRPDR